MVELIPKKEYEKVLPWQSILFSFALVALILAAGAYVVIYFSINRAAQEIESLEGEIAKRGTASEKQLEKDVLETQTKINFFSQIIEMHRKPSRLFPKLEERTHPQSWFSSFNLNLETGILELRGQTANFQTISQQISALREESSVKGLKLSDLSLAEEGQTKFTLLITLDLQIFK